VIGYQDGSKWVWETVKADYADAKAERSRRTDKRNERVSRVALRSHRTTPATFASEMLTGVSSEDVGDVLGDTSKSITRPSTPTRSIEPNGKSASARRWGKRWAGNGKTPWVHMGIRNSGNDQTRMIDTDAH
jgi:hypothetical protein